MDNELTQVEKWFRLIMTATWGAVIIYYLSPQLHSFFGVCRAVLTAVATSSAMFLWWMGGAPITEYQQLVLIVLVSALADSVLVGLLKVLVMFRQDPIGTINKIRGPK